jgi:anti-sigma B factor antagonist
MTCEEGSGVQLRLSQNDDLTVLTLSGELDLESCDPFSAAIDQAAENGARRVVIDLSEVSYMESRAFGCLLTAYHRLGPGRLAVVSAPELRKLFAAARLDDILCVVPDLAEAQRCFAQS